MTQVPHFPAESVPRKRRARFLDWRFIVALAVLILVLLLAVAAWRNYDVRAAEASQKDALIAQLDRRADQVEELQAEVDRLRDEAEEDREAARGAREELLAQQAVMIELLRDRGDVEGDDGQRVCVTLPADVDAPDVRQRAAPAPPRGQSPPVSSGWGFTPGPTTAAPPAVDSRPSPSPEPRRQARKPRGPKEFTVPPRTPVAPPVTKPTPTAPPQPPSTPPGHGGDSPRATPTLPEQAPHVTPPRGKPVVPPGLDKAKPPNHQKGRP